MGLEDLRDDELDALEKGGLQALPDDALTRLEGGAVAVATPPAPPEMPAPESAPIPAEMDAIASFPRRAFGGLRDAAATAARPIAEPIDRGIRAVDELAAPIVDSPNFDPAVKLGAAAMSRGATAMGMGRFERDALAGVLGTIAGSAGAARAFGFDKAGEMVSRVAEESAKAMMPADPGFADQVAAGFGSMATFMVPGYGVQAGAGKLAAFAPRLAAMLGLSASAVLESAVEGGEAYNQAFEKTKDPEVAQRAGNMAFWANLPLVYFTNKMYFPEMGQFGVPGGAWGVHKAIEGALTEGGQEASQAIIGNLATKDPVMQGVLESFGVGAITGGGMGAAVDLAGRPGAKAQAPAPPAPAIPGEIPTARPFEAAQPPEFTPAAPQEAPAAAPDLSPDPELQAMLDEAPEAELEAPAAPEVPQGDLVPPLSVPPLEAPAGPPETALAAPPVAPGAVLPPEVAPGASSEVVAPPVEPSDAAEPSGNVDTSFGPEVTAAEPTQADLSNVMPTGELVDPHQMTPEQLARRFPGATPEDMGRLVGRAVLAGERPHEAALALPGVKEALDEREDALRAEETKEQVAGKSPTPLRDLIKQRGISPEAAKEYEGEFKKDNLRGFVRKTGTTPDYLREAAVEAGILPEGADLNAFFERFQAEMRLGPKRGIKPGKGYELEPGAETGVAEPGPAFASEPRAPKVPRQRPEMSPAEASATIEQAGIKRGDEVATVRPFESPVYGKIATGSKVKVVAIDLEGAQALVQYGEENLAFGRPVAVVPLGILAKPVRAEPYKPAGPAEVKRTVAESTGTRPAEKPLDLAESKALRIKIAAEVRASREGAAEARREMREGIIKDLKDRIAAEKFESKMLKNEMVTGKKYEQHLRDRIVAAARLWLPVSERGTLLSQAAKADSLGDMAKAFRDIEAKANLIYNRELMADIRVLADRVMTSKTFPVSVKQRIRSLLEGIRTENWSDKTIERLRVEQEFVDHLRETGEDVTIPQWLLDRLAKLSYRPLDSIPTDELQRIYNDLVFLVERGKDIRQAMKALDEMAREEKLAEIIAGSTDKTVKQYATTERASKRAFGGPALTWAQEQKNRWLRVVDVSQQVGIYVTPVQVVVDDGGPAERQLLWEPLQEGYIQRVRMVSEGNEILAKLFHEHGILNQQERDRILTVIYKEQDLRPHLQKMGMTDDKIDAVKLTPKEQAWADGLREPFKRRWVKDALTRISAELFNKEFIEEPNYFPLMTKGGGVPRAMPAEEVLAFEMDLRRKNVERGRIMERIEGAAREFRTDLEGIFLDGIRQQANLIYMAKPILKAHGIVRDERYGLAKGDARQEFWKDYLDTLARDGRFSRGRMEWMIDFLRKNVAVGGLSFKPHVALIQFSSLGNGATATGGGFLYDAMHADPEWDAFVEKNMPLVHERHGGDPVVQEVLDGGLLPGAKTAGLKYIAKADHWTAKKVGLAAYFQYLDRHGLPRDLSKPVPQALAYAQAVPGRIMASPWLIDMPLALSRGGPIARAALQFQSESLAKFAILTHQVFGGTQSKAEAAQDMGWLMGSLLLETGVRSGWIATVMGILFAIGAITKKQYEDRVNQDDLVWKALVLNSLNTVPFVGAVGNYLAYDSGPIPVVDTIGDTISGTGKAIVGTAQERPLKAMRGVVEALTAIAMLSGVPGAGVAGWIARQPLRGLHDKKAKKGGSRL